MAQNFFQFKKFRIDQENSFMKVTTEACLFGALVSKEIYKELKNESLEAHKSLSPYTPSFQFLDIGGGTGILSLMIAQQNPDLEIEAVEIDKESAQQCFDNFKASPWFNRLKVFPMALQDFLIEYPEKIVSKYDFIISNPPFHQNQLTGNKAGKMLAHHSSKLTLDELFQSANSLIKPDGQFWVLLPSYRFSEAENTALQNNFFLKQSVHIRATTQHNPLRVILKFSPHKTKPVNQEFVIKETNAVYSDAFKRLLINYYL